MSTRRMDTSLSAQLTTGDGRRITVKDVVDLYREVYSRSSPSQGKVQRLSDDTYSLTCHFTTTDCDVMERIKTMKIYSLSTRVDNGVDRCIESVRCISDAHEITEIASVTSDNGRFLARLRAPSNSNQDVAGSKKQLLEIWDRGRLLKTLDTSDLDAHGPINTDPIFSSFVWCPFGEQDKLLYICQSKSPKSLSFFKAPTSLEAKPRNDNEGPSNRSTDSNPSRGEDGAQKDDWGEGLRDVSHSIAAVIDIANNFKITTIDVDGFSLASSQWLDYGSKIVSVAYQETPRRIGIIYSNNRPSKIMIHDWQTSSPNPFLELESETDCYHTPRVDNAGDRFLYLANSHFGPHKHSSKIFMFDLQSRTNISIKDSASGKEEFFIENIPRCCFSSDNKQFLLVTSDYLSHHMMIFSLDKFKFSKVEFPTTGVALLDFRYDIILASGSEVNATPTLFVANLNSSPELVAWHQIEDCVHLDEIEYEAYQIKTADRSDTISALLITPNLKVLQQNYSIQSPDSERPIPINHESDLPTVVVVHGGPHSAFVSGYMPWIVLSARLGLRVLLVNYRGSTGVSEEYLRSLSGRIGELDVGDCLQAIRFSVQSKGLNPSKLIIQGGSHGGFLACHLSCQEEFKFTSAIIRNPVVDLSSIWQTSDMSDWAFSVALKQDSYHFDRAPTSQEVVTMFECSPIFKISRANVPTLMQLGNTDQRVKMFQGQLWVNILKARGVETMCKIYADKHDLAKADVHGDATITAFLWILNHLPKK